MTVSRLMRKVKWAKIVPKPGAIEHASVVCCAACERCVIIDGDDTYRTAAILEPQGWRKTLGKWICGECAG